MRYGKYFQNKHTFRLSFPNNPSPVKKRKKRLFKHGRFKIRRQRLKTSSTSKGLNTIIFISVLMAIIAPSPFLINLAALVALMSVLFFIKCTLNLFERHQAQYSTKSKSSQTLKPKRNYSLIHYLWIAIPFAITSHTFHIYEAHTNAITTSLIALVSLFTYALYQRSQPLVTKNDNESIENSLSSEIIS